MKIPTKGRLATTTALGTIALIAAMTWWANAEVNDAERQRRHTAQISRALNDLRLVTFEYVLHRQERARLQEEEVARRLEGLLAENGFGQPEPAAVLAELRERSASTHRIFQEFLAAPTDQGVRDQATRRFEAQLSSRLLILQQQSLADAF